MHELKIEELEMRKIEALEMGVNFRELQVVPRLNKAATESELVHVFNPRKYDCKRATTLENITTLEEVLAANEGDASLSCEQRKENEERIFDQGLKRLPDDERVPHLSPRLAIPQAGGVRHIGAAWDEGVQHN
mmetsp:Transcript_46475/g.115276  ORF Transcript_46475/g.115276 Transcript_46475/m.115276 type:complete len:133 (-) Transcript_46475:316-714(-)